MGGLCEERSEKGRGGRKVERKGQGAMEKITKVAIQLTSLIPTKGPFKCYVMQMGVGECQLFRKKALRRCKVQRY